MKTTTMKNSPFRSELRDRIKKYIRAQKANGTIGMSVENLMQCVRAPSHMLDGAPFGTNAVYYYRDMFREICTEPAIAKFVIEGRAE